MVVGKSWGSLLEEMAIREIAIRAGMELTDFGEAEAVEVGMAGVIA